MSEPLDLVPILRRHENWAMVCSPRPVFGSASPYFVEFYDHAPEDIDALAAEVVRLRVEAAPSVPPLADALVGTVAEAHGEIYVRVRVSENDGWTLGWRSIEAEGWVSSAWLCKADAVVISVPREVNSHG
jgi:hypothetical protein